MGDGVGRDVSGVGRLGSEARSWDLRAFSLVMLSCPQKVRNGNCEGGCEGKRRGVPSHKRARVHNNFKS